jgi:hypothetical protein
VPFEPQTALSLPETHFPFELQQPFAQVSAPHVVMTPLLLPLLELSGPGGLLPPVSR